MPIIINYQYDAIIILLINMKGYLKKMQTQIKIEDPNKKLRISCQTAQQSQFQKLLQQSIEKDPLETSKILLSFAKHQQLNKLIKNSRIKQSQLAIHPQLSKLYKDYLQQSKSDLPSLNNTNKKDTKNQHRYRKISITIGIIISILLMILGLKYRAGIMKTLKMILNIK